MTTGLLMTLNNAEVQCTSILLSVINLTLVYFKVFLHLAFLIYSLPFPLFTLFWDADGIKPFQSLISSWFQPIEES